VRAYQTIPHAANLVPAAVAFRGKSPDKLAIEHVREYRLHLIGRGLKATSINPIIGALRFFYGTTLGRKEMIEVRQGKGRKDRYVMLSEQLLGILRA
jgi:site-specific recombinase XerD